MLESSCHQSHTRTALMLKFHRRHLSVEARKIISEISEAVLVTIRLRIPQRR